MKNLNYNQDGNSGFIIESETNNQVAVIWTDTDDEEEIKELEKLTKLFIASPYLLEALQELTNSDLFSNIVHINARAGGKKQLAIAWEKAQKALEKALM